MQVKHDEDFTVTVELIESMRLGHHILETWRSKKHGGIDRLGGLPPVVAYDAETGRCIYRAWPNRDGKFGPRENGQPTEIFDTEYEPHMRWHADDGTYQFMVRPSKIIRDPKTNEITRFDYSESKVTYFGHSHLGAPLPSLDFSY